jgi:hypothetical protein
VWAWAWHDEMRGVMGSCLHTACPTLFSSNPLPSFHSKLPTRTTPYPPPTPPLPSEEEEAKKVPYEEEMALCDYLVKYLQQTFLTDNDSSAPTTAASAAGAPLGSGAALENDGVRLQAFKCVLALVGLDWLGWLLWLVGLLLWWSLGGVWRRRGEGGKDWLTGLIHGLTD